MRKLPKIHPGEVLLEEFLAPMGISQNALAVSVGVSPRRINEIVLGKRAITADTALWLAHYFGTSEPFWMALQAVSTSRKPERNSVATEGVGSGSRVTRR